MGLAVEVDDVLAAMVAVVALEEAEGGVDEGTGDGSQPIDDAKWPGAEEWLHQWVVHNVEY